MTETTWLGWLAVAGGSAAGGLLRHLLSETLARDPGSVPWTTVLINAAGSFAIGLVFGLTSSGTAPTVWPLAARQGVMAGVLGGFTTFSAFSLQTVTLMQQGAVVAAAANVAASVGLGLLACWAGLSLAAGLR